jgi:four helix bundle protein
MARASLNEVQAQLLIAKDIGYLPSAQYKPLEDAGVTCHKLLIGLINKTKAPNNQVHNPYLLTQNSERQ